MAQRYRPPQRDHEVLVSDFSGNTGKPAIDWHQQQGHPFQQPNRIAFVVGITAVGLLKLSLNGIGGDACSLHELGLGTAPTQDSVVGTLGMELEPVGPQAFGEGLDRRVI